MRRLRSLEEPRRNGPFGIHPSHFDVWRKGSAYKGGVSQLWPVDWRCLGRLFPRQVRSSAAPGTAGKLPLHDSIHDVAGSAIQCIRWWDAPVRGRNATVARGQKARLFSTAHKGASCSPAIVGLPVEGQKPCPLSPRVQKERTNPGHGVALGRFGARK